MASSSTSHKPSPQQHPQPLPDIPPNPPRWEPSSDPANIHIPGLDTTASVSDQIDHIEQLITIKLQNVDANMAKIQHLMQTRLLPAFKRFSVGTEPVREAARFWTSFYEEAAQVRIPTSDLDFDQPSESHPSHSQHDEGTTETGTETADEEQEEGETSSADITLDASVRTVRPSPDAHDPPSSVQPYDSTTSETSFAPGEAAVSSTPAANHHGLRHHHPADTTSSTDQPSWSASLESPLVRLNRLQDFASDPRILSPSAASTTDAGDSRFYDEGDTIQAPPHPHPHPQAGSSTSYMYTSPNKGKARSRRPSDRTLRQDVLRQTLSPLRPLRSKQKTPKAAPAPPSHPNPYLPKDTKNPGKWDGLVDLRTTPLRTGMATNTRTPKRFAAPLPSPFGGGGDGGEGQEGDGDGDGSKVEGDDSDEDEDEFGLPPGMSPPVTMAFATMPRVGQGVVSALPKLGRTPSKQAVQRIGRDLIGDSARYVPPESRVQDRGGGGIFGGAGGAGGRSATRGPGGGMVVKGSEETSLSSAATPPSLTRLMRRSGIGAYESASASESVSSFAAHDSTMDSIMRRIGGVEGGYDDAGTEVYDRDREYRTGTGTVAGLSFGSKASQQHPSSSTFPPAPAFKPPIPAPILGHLPTAALTSGHLPETPSQQQYGHFDVDPADGGENPATAAAALARQQMYRDEPTETYNYNIPARALRAQEEEETDPLTRYNNARASSSLDEEEEEEQYVGGHDGGGVGVGVGDDSLDSLDDDDDSIIHDTAHPSAAFLLASQQRGVHDQDDSFDSAEDSADYYDEVGEGEGVQAGGFFNDADGDEDSDEDSFEREQAREAEQLRAAAELGGGRDQERYVDEDDGWDDD